VGDEEGTDRGRETERAVTPRDPTQATATAICRAYNEIIPERERAKIAERERERGGGRRKRGERGRSTPFGDNATFHY